MVGMHEMCFDSPSDTIYLCHDAKSRRGFAEGAVRAAEWLPGKQGFYDFKDIWRETLDSRRSAVPSCFGREPRGEGFYTCPVE